MHFTGAYMRVPILPLYASAHGATPVQIGAIVGANTLIAALAAIPLGRASDRWGRRALLMLGATITAVTSLSLPLVTSPLALAALYGFAGLGLAAFTPSMMSLVGDLAPPGAAGQAFAWYTTALYTGFGTGPIVGGLVADLVGYRATFVVGGLVVSVAVGFAFALPRGRTAAARPAPRRARAPLPRRVWAGWVATLAGVAPWAALITFFPLLGRQRGLSGAAIGLVLGAQALMNTAARLPAGYVVDRTRARGPIVVVGLASFAVTVALLPHLDGLPSLVVVSALSGIGYAFAFVAVGAVLAEASTPATRGLVMGGYSTAIYVGVGTTSVSLGPLIAARGFAVGFAVDAACALVATALAAVLWRRRPRPAARLTAADDAGLAD